METNISLLWTKYNHVFKICVTIMFAKGYFINKASIMENTFIFVLFSSVFSQFIGTLRLLFIYTWKEWGRIF